MTERALSSVELKRTARQMILPEFGQTGQRILSRAHVAVVGAGGLGSPVITYLAAAGIGHLTVIDDDIVDASNLHRQFLHSAASVGQPKVDSVLPRVREIAPECTVTLVRERLTAENADELLTGCDVIVDGSDTFETRFTVNDAAHRRGVPLVWGAVLAWSAQVTVLWPNPPQGSGVDAISLTDVFPDTAETRNTVSCSTAGVMGAVCGQAGSVMALEVIKLLTGIGQPLVGRMMVIDGLRAETHEVSLRTSTDKPVSVIPRALAAIPVGALVVDVRFKHETQNLATNYSTIHLPLENVLQITNPADARAVSLVGASASSPIVTVCAEGPRSIRAARHLMARGFPVAGFLDGGLV